MAAVGALAAQVAHEINNPIAVIAGIAEAIGAHRRARAARGRDHAPDRADELAAAGERQLRI